jgi:hypothetical protein
MIMMEAYTTGTTTGMRVNHTIDTGTVIDRCPCLPRYPTIESKLAIT